MLSTCGGHLVAASRLSCARRAASLSLQLKKLPNAAAKRFSSSSDAQAELMKRFNAVRPRLMQGAMIGAAGLAVYGVSVFVFDITFYLMNLSPSTVGFYGFVSGFCAAASALEACERYKRPQGRGKWYDSLGGRSLLPGKLRAYKIDSAGWRLDDANLLRWQSPRVQLIFDVKGQEYRGLCTVEAVKENAQLNVTFVGLDVMNDAEDRVLISGNEGRMYVKDQLRDLVELKRAHKPIA